jgi:DNA invertase Pin-like site-specific DNA recombinase
MDLAGVYKRVSSHEQEEFTGYKRQEEACVTSAVNRRLIIDATEQEDVTGKTPLSQRPGMLKLVNTMQMRGITNLLVEDRSRLAREEWAAHGIVHELQELGFTILYADGTAAPTEDSDEMEFAQDSMQHLMSAWERRRIVKRLKAGRRIKEAEHPGHRSQGGKLPFGYRRTPDEPGAVKGLVEVDPAQAKVVVDIYRLRGLGLVEKQLSRFCSVNVELGRRGR